MLKYFTYATVISISSEKKIKLASIQDFSVKLKSDKVFNVFVDYDDSVNNQMINKSILVNADTEYEMVSDAMFNLCLIAFEHKTVVKIGVEITLDSAQGCKPTITNEIQEVLLGITK